MAFVEIKKTLFRKGLLQGTPCLSANLLVKQGEEATFDYIVAKILETKLRHVLVTAHLKDTPFVKDILIGVSNKNKIVTFYTDGKADISPLRSVRNLRFVINAVPPTGVENSLHLANLPLLREDDEICLILNTMEEFDNAVKFITSKTITKPLVLFLFKEKDKQVRATIEEKYLKLAETFFFKSRLQFLA